MSLSLKQWDGGLVTPKDDGLLYHHFEPTSGIFYGCAMTISGSTAIQITSGKGLICGREFQIEQEIVACSLPETGSSTGMLVLKVDMSVPTSSNPLSFVTYLGSHTLVQQDINQSGTVYELLLATFSATATQISALTTAVETLAPLAERMVRTGTATLAVADWVDHDDYCEIQVSYAGATATNNIIATYAPASYSAWAECGVRLHSQGAGTLTFRSDSLPEVALTANILILGL